MLTPVARTNGLIAEDIWDEVVVYDQFNDRVHRLNASAALIWRQADGTRTTADLAELLHARLNLPADEALVRVALEDLDRAELLANLLPVDQAIDAISRRDLFERLAAVALLLPVVASIVAPAPLDAATGTMGPDPAPGTTVVASAGTYSGTLPFITGNCGTFFNFATSESVSILFSAGLTSCSISEQGGTRVTTGSVTGLTYQGVGSGTIGGQSATWTHNAVWTSNQTIVFTDTFVFPGLNNNCSGNFRGTCNK